MTARSRAPRPLIFRERDERAASATLAAPARAPGTQDTLHHPAGSYSPKTDLHCGDWKRRDAILALALTNPELDARLWQIECQEAAEEIAAITPQEVQRAKEIITRVQRQYQKSQHRNPDP